MRTIALDISHVGRVSDNKCGQQAAARQGGNLFIRFICLLNKNMGEGEHYILPERNHLQQVHLLVILLIVL